jgi:hypothetical protein
MCGMGRRPRPSGPKRVEDLLAVRAQAERLVGSRLGSQAIGPSTLESVWALGPQVEQVPVSRVLATHRVHIDSWPTGVRPRRAPQPRTSGLQSRPRVEPAGFGTKPRRNESYPKRERPLGPRSHIRGTWPLYGNRNPSLYAIWFRWRPSQWPPQPFEPLPRRRPLTCPDQTLPD